MFPKVKVDRKRLGANVDRVLERAVLAMVNDRFPHALLLVGPEGLGRELAAQEIAIQMQANAQEQLKMANLSFSEGEINLMDFFI